MLIKRQLKSSIVNSYNRQLSFEITIEGIIHGYYIFVVSYIAWRIYSKELKNDLRIINCLGMAKN